MRSHSREVTQPAMVKQSGNSAHVTNAMVKSARWAVFSLCCLWGTFQSNCPKMVKYPFHCTLNSVGIDTVYTACECEGVCKCSLMNSSEELQLPPRVVKGRSAEMSDTKQFGSLSLECMVLVTHNLNNTYVSHVCANARNKRSIKPHVYTRVKFNTHV